jgi:WD40 repeat protein
MYANTHTGGFCFSKSSHGFNRSMTSSSRLTERTFSSFRVRCRPSYTTVTGMMCEWASLFIRPISKSDMTWQRDLYQGRSLYSRHEEHGVRGLTYDTPECMIADPCGYSGHVAEVTSCSWHPKDSQTFITSSADSTIRYASSVLNIRDMLLKRHDRIWDVEDRRKQKTVIVVKSKERGARTKVMSCSYSPEGNMIGGGVFCACTKGKSSANCVL